MDGMTMMQNRPSFFRSRALYAALAAVLLMGIVVAFLFLGDELAPKEGKDFRLDAGTCSGTSMTAQTELTVTNLTGEAIRVRVGIEYRDLDGRLVDKDTAVIEVGERDSVRHREVTITGSAAELIRTCPIVSVDATWS